MVYINEFNKFYSLVTDLKNSGVSVHLYGNTKEKFTGVHAGLSTPPKNTLSICIVALTSVGTIYCKSYIALKNSEAVENAKQLYNQLSVSNANVLYSEESGTVTIK